MATQRTTYLAALNVMLTNIGQQPAVNVNNTNPQVALAKTVLDQVNSDVQSEGWAFNRESNYPLLPDSSGKIRLPNNVVSFDLPYNSRYNVVIRNGFIYDKVNHTDVWDDDTKLEVDIVWLFDFEDLPNAIRNYITIRAANLFAMRTTGSIEISKYGEKEEMQARATALDYETQQGDYNFFSTPEGIGYGTYTPFNAIRRY